jgi:hypothetical protein
MAATRIQAAAKLNAFRLMVASPYCSFAETCVTLVPLMEPCWKVFVRVKVPIVWLQDV